MMYIFFINSSVPFISAFTQKGVLIFGGLSFLSSLMLKLFP